MGDNDASGKDDDVGKEEEVYVERNLVSRRRWSGAGRGMSCHNPNLKAR
jgi:hypothetical protein